VEVSVSAATGGRCGAAIVADAQKGINRTTLAVFDAESGAVLSRGELGPSATFDTGSRGLAWVDGGRSLLVGDRARAANGYPVHRFEREEGCQLRRVDDAIVIGQKPIALREVP
jgi:hypothetical protein